MLVKNFISYTRIVEELIDSNYVCLIIKVGSDRCPPCVALDNGPLDELTKAINKGLNGKECLMINVNLSKQEGVEELFTKLQLSPPDSIPAFYIFAFKDNKLTFLKEDRGYDMQNPLAWRRNFAQSLLEKIQ